MEDNEGIFNEGGDLMKACRVLPILFSFMPFSGDYKCY